LILLIVNNIVAVKNMIQYNMLMIYKFYHNNIIYAIDHNTYFKLGENILFEMYIQIQSL